MLVTLMVQVREVWVWTAASSNSTADSSGSDIVTALSFSLTVADELGAWCTTAKLKMKVGVVSVTVEQHTEGRLQVSQSMLNLEMAAYNEYKRFKMCFTTSVGLKSVLKLWLQKMF